MKKISEIASVESKAAFQEKLLEKFVQDNLPDRPVKPSRIDGMGRFAKVYTEIEWCAAEAPVIGTVDIFFETNNPAALRRLSIPTVSRFFVFCKRDKEHAYKVACSTSLS